MNRREALLLAAGSSLFVHRTLPGAPHPQDSNSELGLVIYTLALRRKAGLSGEPKEDLFEPFAFLDYCRSLGAMGAQLPLGIREADFCRQLRDRAGQYGMFIEGIVQVPKADEDLARFEAEVRTAAQAGALVLRTAIFSGRRYEQFDTLAEYRSAAEQARRAVFRAVPVLRRHRVRLAIENHKDQRVEEHVALLRAAGSEYVGACVDLGNNFALLEDPITVVEALAPWAFSVHIKDQAVQEYQDGFLFADVPLGEGFLDLKQMVDILRRARPKVRFNLETLTRDPLKVPVLTEKYWATFPEVAGRDLARTLRIVRARQAPRLPQVSHLPLAEQVAAEAAGIARSLQYARRTLAPNASRGLRVGFEFDPQPGRSL